MSIKTLIGSMIFGLVVFFSLAYYSETYAAFGVIGVSLSIAGNIFWGFELNAKGLIKLIIAAVVIAACATIIGVMYSFFVAAVVTVPIYLITLPMNKSFRLALEFIK